MQCHFYHKIFFVLLALCSGAPKIVIANSYQDSLSKFINKHTNDSNEARAYMDLGWSILQQNPDSCKKLMLRAISILESQKNLALTAKAYNIIAIANSLQGKFEEAIAYYDTSYTLRKQINDTLGIAAVLNNLGNVYRYQGKYEKALDYLIQSLQIEELYGNRQRISEGYGNIGSVYGEADDRQKALEYFLKAYEYADKADDNKSLAGLTANMASVYAGLKKNDSALYYGNLALQHASKLNDTYNKSVAIAAIGFAHYNMGNYAESIKCHEQSYNYSKEIDDMNGMAQSSMALADVLHADKQYNRSIASANNALEYATAIEAPAIMSKSLRILSYNYVSIGDYKKAYEYEQEYQLLDDSLLNAEKNKSMQEMIVKFETEKKEAQNKLLQSENKNKDLKISQQRNGIIFLVGALALLIASGYFFYQNKQIKQREQMQREMLHQQELRTRAVLEAEETERQRIGRELHDGVGQILATAKLNLAALTNDSEQNLQIKNAMELVDESAREVRSISHNMLPNVLINAGLKKAVMEFTEKINASGTIKLHTEVVGLDKKINATTESFIYRIVQELAANILKHAQATEANIQLIEHDNELSLMIEDNGCGFDYDAAMAKGGAGLRNILSRIDYLKGHIHYDTRQGHGTTATVEIPL